jgi:hypothetical protein
MKKFWVERIADRVGVAGERAPETGHWYFVTADGDYYRVSDLVRASLKYIVSKDRWR